MAEGSGPWPALGAGGVGNGPASACAPVAGLPGVGVMNGEPLRCTVVVTNPQGLHFRPATLFAEKARGFQSSVAVGCGNRRVDGKSGMDLIFLQALEGAELVLEVAGPDAAEALPALAALLADPGEAADADPSVPPKG